MKMFGEPEIIAIVPFKKKARPCKTFGRTEMLDACHGETLEEANTSNYKRRKDVLHANNLILAWPRGRGDAG